MTDDSLPQNSEAEKPQIESLHFEYGVGSGSVPGVILVDHDLEMAIECLPTDNWVGVYNHDFESLIDHLALYGVKNHKKHLFNIPYFEKKEDRERLIRLIVKALDLE